MSAPAILPCRVADLLDPKSVRSHFTRQQTPVDSIPTPFPSWNRHCRDDGGGIGLARGWHVIIAARSGAGKSLLALNVAAKAIEAGERVAFLALEMSAAQLSTRLYAILTGGAVHGIERGAGFDRTIAGSVERELSELSKTGGSFWVNTQPIYRPDAVEGLAQYFIEKHDCSLVITDYLQLAAARNAETLFSSVSDISARLREFAARNRVVSVGLSQFNRTTSANQSDQPTMFGLMGASSIENDADQVLLVDHTQGKEEGPRRRSGSLLLAKNRHGSVGEIPVVWDYTTLQVREVMDG